MARPPRKRSGPDTTPARRNATDSTTGKASIDAAVVDLAAYRTRSGRCWRCGVPFAGTTLADLERCTQLAREQEGGTA